MLKTQLDILFLLIGSLCIAVVALFSYTMRLAKILRCMKSNLNLKNIKVTDEMIEYARDQRDKYHWSSAKYQAYNETLKQYGAL